MSLEAWGDGGDTGPAGFVTNADAEQMVQDAVAEKDAEIGRLRLLVESAYAEGFSDNREGWPGRSREQTWRGSDTFAALNPPPATFIAWHSA